VHQKYELYATVDGLDVFAKTVVFRSKAFVADFSHNEPIIPQARENVITIFCI